MWKKLKNWLILLVLLFILGRFVTQTYGRMLTNSNASEGDQLAFLQLGLDMLEHGVLTDGTRNPLYAVFLAVVAHRDWAYFTYAKLLSMTFGLLAIVAVFKLGRRRFDAFTGLVAAYLLSINVEFIVHSATALTESLLVLTFVLAWFAMLKALDDKDQARYWALAGALAGLAYLAKGSAQLLVFSFLALAFLFYRFQIFRSKSLWLFLGSYMVIVSPLWIYNTINYGSPTFNYAITHQMWMDGWREWHPDDLDHLPTALTYVQTHTPQEIIDRQWSGMQAMRNILIKTLWPTRTLMVDRFLLSPLSSYVLVGLLLLPFLLWPFSRRYLRHHSGAVLLTLLVTTLFFLLFAWYVPIVALGQRFMLPVIPLIFILLAHIVSQAGQQVMALGVWPKRLVILLGLIVLGLQLRWAIYTNLDATQALLTQDVFAQDRQFNSDAATTLEWLAQQSPGIETVAWGPSGNTLPIWAYSDRLDVNLYPPNADTLADLTANLVSRDIDFVIVDADMVARHRSLYKDIFPSDGARVDIPAIPDGWALTYAYRAMPCDWCVFRLLDSRPPQQPLDVRLGDSIQLVGYDLDRADHHPGDLLHLTLHWTTTAPLDADYTVFTQLLGPDFQLHGQLDHQPIDNLWPTTRWQPGERLADRYDIPIDPNAPPGSYQILVGMYNGQTGERLPVSQDGNPVPDNAIRLGEISLSAGS
ncbi:MAG: glycosyltransferase family 39 protein [Anaerolineaceae bacterium]|nr:glycosyltransferase family 39 protein [Anaerolineaceae bacterium]